MIIKDKIYGKTEIKEPVLIKLLKSKPLLRLKNISQFGIPDKYYHLKNFDRYEHSVGVMILLKKLGATIEEQVAGLLHDVSVLAFSHIADWLFGGGKRGVEDYHDSIHEKFVKNTEIPKILKNKNLKGLVKKSGEKIVKKFRYVDPKIIFNEKLVRLSELDRRFQRVFNKHKETNEKGLTV